MSREIFFDLTPAEFREANKREPIITNKDDLIKAFQKLGLFPGIRLVVHTSLASLGHLDGGCETYCQALMESVSESGTLLLPALTAYPKDGENYLYNPLTTPCDVGAVPEYFRKLPGVVRSWDPTHSFCAWGDKKEYFVRNHHKMPTMHADSPLGLLEQSEGYCLMVGCCTEVTFMHVVETACKAPCLGSRTEEYQADLPGAGRVLLRGWGWRKGPCRALRHEEIFGFLREHSLVTETMLGRSHLLLFRLSDYREAYSRLLKGEESGCSGCPVRPRKVRQSVESDWDETSNRLKTGNAFCMEWCDNISN